MKLKNMSAIALLLFSFIICLLITMKKGKLLEYYCRFTGIHLSIFTGYSVVPSSYFFVSVR